MVLYKHSSSQVRSSYIVQHPSHRSSVNRILSCIVVRYTCLSNIRIHYSKSLSDGGKKIKRENYARADGTLRYTPALRCFCIETLVENRLVERKRERERERERERGTVDR